MIYRLLRCIDKFINAAFILCCALLFAAGVYGIYDDLYVYGSALDRSFMSYKPEGSAAIAEAGRITDGQVGWITVDATTIDYPLMQGKDNYEYLNLDPYGNFSMSGSIFLDSSNDKELTDEYVLIYGHHMGGGAMFGSLDSFLDEKYFEEHRTGSLSTEERVYSLELFAVASFDATDRLFFSPGSAERSKVIPELEKSSIIYRPPGEGSIVALTTCWGDTEVSRLLVLGTITEKEAEE